MRVISGRARGTKLVSIDSDKTKPTQDRIKESIFNIIQDYIKDSVFLDLFAGSGAIGIEAISRGAKRVYFCEKNRDAIKYIKENLSKTRFEEYSEIYNGDYSEFLKNSKEKYDIIYIDPPYKEMYGTESIKFIKEFELLKKDGFAIIETDEFNRDITELNKIDGLDIFDTRKYGRVNLIFIRNS